MQLVLQNCCTDELKSDVAFFVIHVQTCLARNKVCSKLRESVLTSHWKKLPRSHTHGNCVTCCKTSFPWTSKTRSTYRFCLYSLQQLFANCTGNNLIRCKTVWNVGGETYSIAFQLVLQQCSKTSCTLLFAFLSYL